MIHNDSLHAACWRRCHRCSSLTALLLLRRPQGPEVRSGDLAAPIEMRHGERYVFTIREGATGKDGIISVNYDGFISDVSVGDELLVDGGLLSFVVVEMGDGEVLVEVVDEGAGLQGAGGG